MNPESESAPVSEFSNVFKPLTQTDFYANKLQVNEFSFVHFERNILYVDDAIYSVKLYITKFYKLPMS